MAGTLGHAKSFEKSYYRSTDGQTHYEIALGEGGSDVISYSTWEELKAHAQNLGISIDSWPEFFEHDSTIDIPLADVERKNIVLRAALANLGQAEASSHWLLARISEYVQRGEQIFFC